MAYIRRTIFYIVLASILAFILLASYHRGLFFDTDFYYIEIIFSLIFIFSFLFNIKDSMNIFTRPYIWFLLGIDILYFVQSFFVVNQLLAFQQFFRWLLVTQLFILILYLKNKKWVNDLIWLSIVTTGVWTSIFGWLAAYDLVVFKDAVWMERISSVFQHANTFGALLAAILISILIRGTSSKWLYSLSSIASYLLTLTIIFTYSRGTWLALPIIWIITLFFLSLKKQILFILHTLFIGLAIILSLPSINESLVNKSHGKGFFIIGIASIFTALIYSLLVYFINKFKFEQKGKIIRWLIPVLVIIVLVFGIFAITNSDFIEKLPDPLENRIKSINLDIQSVQERGFFYQDAAKLIKENILFGHGGGSWRELYYGYQSYPYISSQAHNFYFQFIVEIGLIGLILFISFLAFLLIPIVRNRNNLGEDGLNRTLSYGLMLLLLLSHSFIDFNMSFLYFLGITFIALALIEYPVTYPIYQKKSKRKTFAQLSMILIVLLSVISLVYTVRFYNADKIMKDLNGKPVSGNEKRLDKAISFNPYEINYRFIKMNIYQQLYNKTKVEQYKKEFLKEALYIKESDSRTPSINLNLSQVFATNGYIKDSVDIVDKAIDKAPWVEELYEQYFVYGFKLAEYYQTKGNTDATIELLKKIITYYNDVTEKRKFLDKQIPTLQYKLFGPTASMDLFAGQTNIIFKNYDKGLEYLIPLTKNKDQKLREPAIMWTVFAYEQLNNQDKKEEYLKLDKNIDIKGIQRIKDIWYGVAIYF